MYIHKTTDFGPYQKHSFINEATGNAFAVVPAIGGNLLGLSIAGENIIDGYQTPEDLTAFKSSKSAVLFPYPNRLRDGQYQFEGQTFQFELSEPKNHNAIHGIGRQAKMEVKEATTGADFASLTCRYESDGKSEIAAYPFAFAFEIQFKISEPNTFEVSLGFENKSETKLPVGLGWHPYFSFGTAIDEAQLTLPPCQFIEVDERLLPTGKKYDYDYFSTAKTIGKTALDNGFLLLNNENKRAEVSLNVKDKTLRYWQEIGEGKFNFLQVYIPPHRTAIAIEPMTCNIDAFNNQEGLVVLNPSEKISAKCGLSFHLDSKQQLVMNDE